MSNASFSGIRSQVTSHRFYFHPSKTMAELLFLSSRGGGLDPVALFISLTGGITMAELLFMPSRGGGLDRTALFYHSREE